MIWPWAPDPLITEAMVPSPPGLLPSTQTLPTPTNGPEPRLFLRDPLPWQPEIDKGAA